MGRGAHGHSHDDDPNGGHGHSHGGGGGDEGHGHSHGEPSAPQYGTELEVVTASVKSLLTGLRERNALPADGDESTHREVDEEQRKHMQQWTNETWAPVTAQLTEMQLQQMRGKLCERPSGGGGEAQGATDERANAAAAARPPPTDVFEAAQFGSEAEMAHLLREKPSAAQGMDIHGLMAIHYAARRPHAPLVKQLLQSGANANATAENERGDTVLMMAVASGDVEVVHEVMDAGADVNLGGAGVAGYPLHAAVQKNRLLPLLMLLQAGADPNVVDSKRQTPMHWAAYQGMVTPMRYLLNHGAAPALADDRGLTPLHWAAALGHLPVVEFLLEQLPEEAAAVSNADGFSPLSMAELNKQEEVVAALRKHLAKQGLLQEKSGEAGAAASGPPLLSDRLFARLCALKKDPRFPYALPFFALPLLWCSIGMLSGYLKPVGMLWSLEILFSTIGGSRNLSFFKRAGPLFVGIFSNSYFHSALLFLYMMLDGGLPPEESWNVLIFLLLNLCLALLYLQLIVSEPGIVEPKEDEVLELMKAIREGKPPSQFCHTCMMRRPARSKHCAVLNRCVYRFDHYCPWLQNSVGSDNHHFFYVFLVAHLLLQLVFLRFLGIHFYYYDSPSFFSFVAELWRTHPYVATLCGWHCLNGFWLALLALQHTIMLLRNQTTTIFWSPTKYAHMKDPRTGKYSSPFSVGLFSNMKEFFFDSTPVKQARWERQLQARLAEIEAIKKQQRLLQVVIPSDKQSQ
mmetsp:Transcript_601/g.1401  ORF Transcript_601/g.1401 Transcript_601/m.1401 type:complete len:743 (+) Transcript_601:69-2297(+)